jgi:hypothetical protein
MLKDVMKGDDVKRAPLRRQIAGEEPLYELSHGRRIDRSAAIEKTVGFDSVTLAPGSPSEIKKQTAAATDIK